MKTAVKHCVSSAYQIGTGGGVEGRRGLAPPPIRYFKKTGYAAGKSHTESPKRIKSAVWQIKHGHSVLKKSALK